MSVARDRANFDGAFGITVDYVITVRITVVVDYGGGGLR
jgi:hypothetical protein